MWWFSLAMALGAPRSDAAPSLMPESLWPTFVACADGDREACVTAQAAVTPEASRDLRQALARGASEPAKPAADRGFALRWTVEAARLAPPNRSWDIAIRGHRLDEGGLHIWGRLRDR
ncbi:MAG: hypothetical protein AAF211_26545, partial [Myxococcota bacterium]